MSTEITTNQVEKITFNDEQITLIRQQIAPKANPTELALFLNQARRVGLDPLARQIYCVPISGKMTIQTSIDGFRVIAERSGDYGGQDAPVFHEENGKIISCSVTVYRFRGDVRYPAAVGIAYMAEYSTGQMMWNKMPHTMISKCAEALALRKAYPQDLSGLYTSDEMDQAKPIQEANEFIPAEVIKNPETLTDIKTKLDSITTKEDLTIYFESLAVKTPAITTLFSERKAAINAAQTVAS
jgi:phage recombination protein Bet